ncbi:hypothetical protein [Haliangium sp.]|uniref:hypothetical protein n=1 Tax=Haliangium sp. TaxID=2663208 RepID=UPI003D11B7A3
MRPILFCAALVGLLALSSACSSSRSPRCKELCQREARCVREQRRLDMHFDEAECVAACTALDRDNEGRHIVDEHAACVDRASDCNAVLGCR